MESIENSSAETLRYIWPLNASGHITTDFLSFNGTHSKWSEESASNLASFGSSLCASANLRKSTIGEEMPTWRAFALERERASVAVLAEPAT